MIASAVFITTLITLAIGILLLQECSFLIPYRHVLFMKYGASVAGFAVAFFFNCFALVYQACRLFLLKDTGRKLVHLEKQLRHGSLAEDLGRRLED